MDLGVKRPELRSLTYQCLVFPDKILTKPILSSVEQVKR